MITTHFMAFFTGEAAPDTDLAPITLAEAKTHLRIIGTTEDDYVTALVGAAADLIERDTGHVMRARNVTFAYDGWQNNGAYAVPLYRQPVNSIGSVAYDAADGASATLAADQYRVRDFAGQSRLVPSYGASWPEIEAISGAVRVTFAAGYASNADVPATLKHACKLLIGHWYENREAVNSERTPVDVPLAYDALIRPHRVRMVA